MSTADQLSQSPSSPACKPWRARDSYSSSPCPLSCSHFRVRIRRGMNNLTWYWTGYVRTRAGHGHDRGRSSMSASAGRSPHGGRRSMKMDAQGQNSVVRVRRKMWGSRICRLLYGLGIHHLGLQSLPAPYSSPSLQYHQWGWRWAAVVASGSR